MKGEEGGAALHRPPFATCRQERNLPVTERTYHNLVGCSNGGVLRVQSRVGVGTVWQGIHASGGWNCLGMAGGRRAGRMARAAF